MADPAPDEVLDEESAYIDTSSLVNTAGTWLDQQGGSAYSENGYSRDTQHGGTSDEPQTPSHHSAPLLHNPYSTQYFYNASSASEASEAFANLDIWAGQVNQGQTTATSNARIASDPVFLHDRSTTAALLNDLDFWIDPDLPADSLLDPPTSCPQEEVLTQAQVDESVHLRYSALGPVDHYHVGTNSTSDGGFGHDMAVLRQLGHHAHMERDLRVRRNVDDPTAFQRGLLQGLGHLQAPPGLSHEATAMCASPQVFATPAQLPLQPYPLDQSLFGYNTGSHVYPGSEAAGPSVDHDAYAQHDCFAGPGHHARDQDFGGQDNDDYSVTSHDPSEMSPSIHRQHRSGPQLYYAGPSQLGLGYNPAAAYQSASADSLIHGSDVDGTFDGTPLSQRPTYNMERNSGISTPSTQQPTPLSNESYGFFPNSLSATTPSEGNSNKKRCVSGRPRSQASNVRAPSKFAEYSDANLLSPTPNAPTMSRQTSSAGSATSYACPNCSKVFSKKSNLTHHMGKYDPEKMNRHRCPHCPKGFRYPRDMRKHVDSLHLGITHRCEKCNKPFTRADNIPRHHEVCPRRGASPVI